MPRVGDDALIDTIRSAVIGDNEAIVTPFGVRRASYADYMAPVPEEIADRPEPATPSRA